MATSGTNVPSMANLPSKKTPKTNYIIGAISVVGLILGVLYLKYFPYKSWFMITVAVSIVAVIVGCLFIKRQSRKKIPLIEGLIHTSIILGTTMIVSWFLPKYPLVSISAALICVLAWYFMKKWKISLATIVLTIVSVVIFFPMLLMKKKNSVDSTPDAISDSVYLQHFKDSLESAFTKELQLPIKQKLDSAANVEKQNKELQKQKIEKEVRMSVTNKFRDSFLKADNILCETVSTNNALRQQNASLDTLYKGLLNSIPKECQGSNIVVVVQNKVIPAATPQKSLRKNNQKRKESPGLYCDSGNKKSRPKQRAYSNGLNLPGNATN